MTLAGLLALGRQRLTAHSSSAALDARLLLCQLLAIDSLVLFREPERPVTEAQCQAYQALLQRRIQGEPVAYLLGRKAFYGHDFVVNAATLIPRPETELLVERALALLPASAPADVAELGTGSGAIAISLALARPHWQVLAIDNSADALAVARHNATRLGAGGKLLFRQGNWLQGVDRVFHLIVSNPPYIAADDPHLQQGDVRFEPQTALVAAEAGLADIARIADEATEHLQAAGWLVVEHGYQQGAAVRDLFIGAGFVQVATHRDLAGHERVTEGQWHPHQPPAATPLV